MQVYKAYFKIIKRKIPSILIYFVVFVAVSMVITSLLGGKSAASAFTSAKANVALFNEDTGSEIAAGLADYLKANCNVVNVNDDRQSIEDALFYGNIDYVLGIPKGFGQSLMTGGTPVSLERTASAASTNGVFMDFVVDRYINMAALYARNADSMPAAQIVGNVGRDLANQAQIDVAASEKEADTNYLSYYFRYLAYTILAVMIMGVTSFMMAFNNADLNNRNLCSPTKPRQMNLQVALGNVVFSVVVWAAMCAVVFLLYGSVPTNTGVLLLCLNALILTFVSLSIGFLAGKFVRSGGVQSAISNVVSLGFSFLGGVFVGQDLLGSTVLGIARFTPAYWYVKAVDGIRGISQFSMTNLQPIFESMLIQLGFAAAIFLVALMLAKYIRPAKEI